MKDVNYWESQLEIALSNYNFELMVESVKNGAFPDDMIMHRIINRDRVDLLEYFLFSPELPQHCKLHYNYALFGEKPAFPYASYCGAVSVLKFLLNDPRVCDLFDFKERAQGALTSACNGGYIEAVEYLLSSQKTRDYCSLAYDNFVPIKSALSRQRKEFMNDLILHHKDFDLIVSMCESLKNIEDHFGEALEVRKLKEQLDNELNRTNQDKLKKRKI